MQQPVLAKEEVLKEAVWFLNFWRDCFGFAAGTKPEEAAEYLGRILVAVKASEKSSGTALLQGEIGEVAGLQCFVLTWLHSVDLISSPTLFCSLTETGERFLAAFHADIHLAAFSPEDFTKWHD